MARLSNVEAALLASTLETRFNTSKKFKVGDLEPGSIIIARCAEVYKGVVEEVAYAILVTFRKNKEDTRCASFDGFDSISTNYVLKNTEEVVHLMAWAAEEHHG
jgi:hypothetical protein